MDGRLPAQPTPLLGREDELRSIQEHLLRGGTRLLTLTGPPGSGKTRLALAAAERMADTFGRGAWFVDLASVAEPALVTLSALRALGVPDTPESPASALIAALRDSDLLLVLDNFEHVLAARTEVAELLTRCPRLKILVTSRQRLDIRWEQEFPVAPLPLPDPGRTFPPAELAQIPSVALFVRRARAAQPSFRLTADNGAAVAEICRRADGLPLAIELAAARIRHLSPAEIARQIAQGYALLAAGPRDAPARQRSLEAAVEWSHRLLDDDAVTLFRRLSVFAGGATREATGEVCGAGEDPTPALTALLDAGLLQRADGPGGRSRYAMLETIRDFAARRLERANESPQVRRRHLQYFADTARAGQPHLGFFLPDAEMKRWAEPVEPEYENITAALEWAGRDEASMDSGLSLAAHLHWWWFLRGRFAAPRAALETLLRRPQPLDDALRSLASTTAAYLACWQGDFAAARPYAERGLEGFRRLGDAPGTAFALHAIGFCALGLGDRAGARANVEEALALAKEAGDDWLVAFAVSFLAIRTEYEGRFPEATRMHEECIAILKRLGGHGQGEGYSLFHLGRIARLRGDLASARAHLSDAVGRFQGLADTRGMVYCLLELALVAIKEGQAVQAARLLGALDAMRLHIGPVFERHLQRDYEETFQEARTALGAEAFSKVWEEGRAMGLDEAAATAAPPPSLAKPRRRRTPLTSREEQVAALVAAGLTNRQIAERLVIGKKTADSHVQHIMDKLGFHSRAQVAAWAAEQRLTPPSD